MKAIFYSMLAAIVSISFLSPAPVQASEPEEIVVYSARKEHLIKPLFDAYTKKTGVKISYITAKANPLLERLKAEGQNTPADLFITVDAGNLWHAAESGLLQPVESQELANAVPENLRDPQNRWFGLSIRARTVVYNADKVSADELSTYEDLATSKWKGRLVLRTSKKVYNQSLVASLIEQHGDEKAEEIVKGWVSNLALDPTSNDTKAMQAVANGIGDVAIVNTYYYGRLMKESPELPLKLFWPNQKSTGVHMNISGAGVTKHAKNKAGAIKLLEWLASEEAQHTFGALNQEFPVNSKVAPSEEVASWGSFKGNPMNVTAYGEKQADAIKLMDRAGYK
ncbi:extracellular solute-binding protein [Halodesulfovibrio marinisediminis]|uniref:Iron(III) transport system substrate-binding protein n=1 Tax=Halodesulfovibrio marinisediminis DSM 17456 TaxID=1121457 RepID=A0A1N6DVY1_9BACT|nr:extracellular solute-binding protein [Halodesulfovibrio marinisediminis]SIN74946.1 iron(III) transport system substrate-binding protein [Halodesulfovibrio marinisediminis DSM 17456]